MKKISTLFLMIFLVVGTLGFVAAEENSDNFDIPEARRVGFFENAFDNIGLAFTFNKEKKIQKALELAEKRLAEAEILSEDDPEAAERAQERYDAFVANAEEILEEIADARVGNENLSMEGMEKMARIQNNFEQHREQASRIYTRALERFEGNNASDEKIERFEGFYERALSRSDEMEEKLLQKREALIKRHKVLAEKSDEELEEILEEIEEGEGLTEARESRTERTETRIQNVMEIKNRNIERARAHLNEANLTESQKEQIANRIENANQRAQDFAIKARAKIKVHKDLMPVIPGEETDEDLEDPIEDAGNSEGSNGEASNEA